MTELPSTTDVLVVGAGPAGIAAACTAAQAGRSVVVLDASPWVGGQLWRPEPGRPGTWLAQHWMRRLEDSGARVFTRATVFAAPSAHSVLVETPRTAWEIAWQKLILATGAREFFLPFPGWTLPGVLGPGGLHGLAKNGWPLAGRRIVVAGSGPLLLAAAASLRQHQAHIRSIAEQAPWSRVRRFGFSLLRHPAKLAQGLIVRTRLAGVPYRCGCWPVRAEGNEHVERVTLTNGQTTWTEDCRYLACAFHLVPNLELPRLLGCQIHQGTVQVDNLQQTTVEHVYCAGEPTGIGGVDSALVEGEIAGLAATDRTTAAHTRFGRRTVAHRFRAALDTTFSLRRELRDLATADTIVCRCEDVRRIQLAAHANWREARLHTRCGMGPCQGRICRPATQYLLGYPFEEDFESQVSSLKSEVFARPPIFPVRLGSLLGPVLSTKERSHISSPPSKP